MTKQTKQQQICSKLESAGYQKDRMAKTAKYIVYLIPNSDKKYFVGKNGALRKGKNIADSISLTDLIKL